MTAMDDDEEAAVMRDAEVIARKKRSNLYNEKGVPYAPWMVRQVDEDAIKIARELRRVKKVKATEKKADVVNILEAATSEISGMGLKAKVVDGDVELVWGTSDEDAVRGFSVEKKPIGFGDWAVAGSYKSDKNLKSKGALGGSYSFTDAAPDEGEYLYRIVADQSDGSREITCQVGVTIESEAQQLQTKIVVAISAAALLAFVFAGLALDPIKG
eukprot:CAMPEP_0118916340 /NCGR_PEP_ID=MMETSP1166-20130328/16346_1 /TAXON_ID=1104430 /ORGANISM="Chrysoreinhardia sp, Strain CCMP3193" /LENGTH=213 /DNA_ID=CAMNT_0006856183 /DNA_START=212 /DNA_END=856 /DNA_ORIENTATION=+